MAEKILVAVAWPYANGPLHLGHIAGAYLPADIFARYHRLKGNEVLMVSGSDQHGTPITIKAEQEGKTPAEIAGRYHRDFLESWQGLGISFDLFTTTGTANHAQVTQDIFLTLLKKGYIYKGSMSQPYCPQCKRFLPDRYIEGTCPFCHSTGARGDQCDDCGKPMNPAELVSPRCRLCGTAPQFQDSEHFFLKLSAFQDKLAAWAGEQGQWRPNVYALTQRYLKEGLKDRAITRDIGWGVAVPLEGYEGKRIYVWFEAVIGYLSATKEWAKSRGDGEGWRPFWQDKDTKSYYFIGKDNIPFHTIIWPAMLMGYGGLNLPYDVPANEFLTIEGKKLSTSRNWAVWLPDYLSRYDPDPLRYLLSINMPDTGDTDFSWREFFRRNNDELVATYGNLVNRVLTFVYRNFEGGVPQSGKLDDQSQKLLDKAEETLKNVGELISQCHFKQGAMAAMALAQEANRYLDDKSPWKIIKEDKETAATSLYVALGVISALKTALYPFLPFSSQKLHRMMGFGGTIESDGWKLMLPTGGQKLGEPEPLFTKLDENLVDEETARLGQA
ncbi:MAG: methionine--tRNA ligase [Dehalococcoidales bacterium]|jgi:methionyl-tRNA synthetase|nr:methionine--tRNA ligase [Dehalococcoidales bacterium]